MISAMSPMLRGPIPGRLRRKVPSALLMFVDGQRFWIVFGFGLALLAIYGPIVGTPDYDGFRYLLLPVLSPWVPALYYKLRPVNPNFLENDGTLEAAQRIAGHADSRTTKLYDRRGQKVLLEDMERIRY